MELEETYGGGEVGISKSRTRRMADSEHVKSGIGFKKKKSRNEELAKVNAAVSNFKEELMANMRLRKFVTN